MKRIRGRDAPREPFRRRDGRLTIGGVSILTLFVLFMVGVAMPQFMRLKRGVFKVACYNMQRKLAEAIAEYSLEKTLTLKLKDNGINQKPLLEGKYILYKMECPEGGFFFFDKFDTVSCSVHPDRWKETNHPDILDRKDRRKQK